MTTIQLFWIINTLKNQYFDARFLSLHCSTGHAGTAPVTNYSFMSWCALRLISWCSYLRKLLILHSKQLKSSKMVMVSEHIENNCLLDKSSRIIHNFGNIRESSDSKNSMESTESAFSPCRSWCGASGSAKNITICMRGDFPIQFSFNFLDVGNYAHSVCTGN
jgi:hypothetical protein